MLLDYYGIPVEIIPDIVPTFAIQGELTSQAARELGLKRGTKISYRAGDQPNNAFSLNVLQPGEAATTAGTSGVIFGITDLPICDYQSRVNTFVHVNHQNNNPRYAVLLCLNGCGILYSWLKNKILSTTSDTITYQQMDSLSAQAPPGAAGLLVFPFGNGAERTLENRNIGATFQQLDFNIHELKHLLRASQEGIIFALNYGFEIMKNIGLNISIIKAGRVNQFSSTLFQKMFSAVTGTQLELFNTDGSEGAARGAGIGAKIYQNFEEAFVGLKRESTVYPDPKLQKAYQEIYQHWLSILKKQLQQC
jgi:xylulokinase